MVDSIKKLEHDEFYNIYNSIGARTPLEAKRATESDEKAFYLKQFDKIFPTYDANKHLVEPEQFGNRLFFILFEKVKKGKISNSDVPEPGFLLMDKNFEHGYHLKPIRQREIDHHVDLRPKLKDLENEVLNFFRMKDKFDDYGMDSSRGTLFYGPPGNGKTHAILRIAEKCISELGAFVFMITDDFGFSSLTDYRDIFAEYPTVFILEEITEKAKKRTDRLLNFLDGEFSWPYNYTFATTNYPGDLPGNIVDRPGRFDRLVSFQNPSREQRKKYLEELMSEERVSQRLLDETENYSLSYLRELVVQLNFYGCSVDSILERFEKKKRRIREAFRTEDEQLGFLTTADENGR